MDPGGSIRAVSTVFFPPPPPFFLFSFSATVLPYADCAHRLDPLERGTWVTTASAVRQHPTTHALSLLFSSFRLPTFYALERQENGGNTLGRGAGRRQCGRALFFFLSLLFPVPPSPPLPARLFPKQNGTTLRH